MSMRLSPTEYWIVCGTGLRKHRRRGVNADNPLARRLRHGDRDPPIPDGKLDQRPVRLACQLDVERNVGRHRCRPFLVVIGERLVPAHRLRLPILPRGIAESLPEPVLGCDSAQDRGRKGSECLGVSVAAVLGTRPKSMKCLEISVAAFLGQSVKEVRPPATCAEKRLVGRTSRKAAETSIRKLCACRLPGASLSQKFGRLRLVPKSGLSAELLAMLYRCYAKLNFTLEILRLRDDGYHDLASLVHTVSLADDLRIELANELLTRVEGLDIDPQTD